MSKHFLRTQFLNAHNILEWLPMASLSSQVLCLQVSPGVYPRESTAPDTVTGIFAMNITKGNTCKFAAKMGAIVML